MEPVTILEKVWQVATSFWRALRFKAHVQMELGWDHSIVIDLYGPSKKWRSVSLVVTASKTDEFVIAKGEVQAKNSKGRWVSVTDLDSDLSLPIVVEKNRQWQGSLSGTTLAEKVKPVIGPVSTCQLRLILRDHHGSKLKSKPLEVTISELVREDWW